MKLVQETEELLHLFAQAFARVRGDEQPHIFADVVVGHARDIARQDDETNSISSAVAKDDDQLLSAAPADTGEAADEPAPAPEVAPADPDTLAVQTQNEHQDALPDSAKTPEQLAAEQQTVDAQRTDAENDHDQTIQQVHGEQSAQDAAAERATMDANAEQQKAAE